MQDGFQVRKITGGFASWQFCLVSEPSWEGAQNVRLPQGSQCRCPLPVPLCRALLRRHSPKRNELSHAEISLTFQSGDLGGLWWDILLVRFGNKGDLVGSLGCQVAHHEAGIVARHLFGQFPPGVSCRGIFQNIISGVVCEKLRPR